MNPSEDKGVLFVFFFSFSSEGATNILGENYEIFMV